MTDQRFGSRAGAGLRRPILFLIFGLAVLPLSGAPPRAQDRPAPPAAKTAGPAPSFEAVEKALFDSINGERTALGLAPLRLSGSLTALARKQSRDMAAMGSLSHDSASGTSLTDRLGAAGVRFSIDGENVVRSSVADPALIHASLMKSGGHRENILRPEFDETGVGMVRGPDGTYFVTEDFIKSVTGRDEAEVRSLVLAALDGARTAKGWPPLAVEGAVQETAQLFAVLKSSGAELPPVPGDYGEARVHVYIGPDLEALAGAARQDAGERDRRTGIGVRFAQTADYPGGAYFVCVIYLIGE